MHARAHLSDQAIDRRQWAMTSPSYDLIARVQPSGPHELDGRASLPYQRTGWVGDHVTAAPEAVTMWPGWSCRAAWRGLAVPKSQHGLGRQEGLGS